MAKDIELVHALIEPVRVKIIRSLLNGPKYISQLASETQSDRSTISYHLGVLERNDLLKSKYEVLVEPRSKGKAARVYEINHKRLDQALEEIEQLLPTLKRKR
jgi:DNA-binding transcriptional ArsR family regulator